MHISRITFLHSLKLCYLPFSFDSFIYVTFLTPSASQITSNDVAASEEADILVGM